MTNTTGTYKIRDTVETESRRWTCDDCGESGQAGTSLNLAERHMRETGHQPIVEGYWQIRFVPETGRKTVVVKNRSSPLHDAHWQGGRVSTYSTRVDRLKATETVRAAMREEGLTMADIQKLVCCSYSQAGSLIKFWIETDEFRHERHGRTRRIYAK